MAIVAEFNYAVSHPGRRDSRPFVDGVLERLEGTPSVAAAGFADFVRTNGVVRYWEPSDSEEVRRSTVGGVVTAGWFEAFGATFVAGRGFGPAAAPRDAVVNQALASMLPGGAATALGQALRVAHPPGAPPRAVEVVGIVADRLTLMDGRSAPAIYLPMPREAPSSIVLVARAADVPAATTAVKAAVTGADPALPWVSLDTLEARALEPLKGLRETAWFGAGLGTVALLLAATGLHAVLAYMIRRRTHEIGIRMAIGAGQIRDRLARSAAGAGARCGGRRRRSAHHRPARVRDADVSQSLPVRSSCDAGPSFDAADRRSSRGGASRVSRGDRRSAGRSARALHGVRGASSSGTTGSPAVRLRSASMYNFQQKPPWR